MNFQEIGLKEPIVQAVTEMGFEQLTPIQEKTIPFIICLLLRIDFSFEVWRDDELILLFLLPQQISRHPSRSHMWKV